MINDPASPDRERGFLTKTDREYLTGEKSYSDIQQERNRRRYIRQHIKNALIDFSLLRELEDRELELIAKDIEAHQVRELRQARSLLLNGMVDTVRFLHLLSAETDISFEEILTEGIRNVEEEERGRELVGINIEKEYAGDLVETGVQKLLSDEALTQAEKKAMLNRISNLSPDVGPTGTTEDENES